MILLFSKYSKAKKNIILLALIIGFSLFIHAQTPLCISHELLEKDVNYQNQYNKINKEIYDFAKNFYQNQARNSVLAKYTLPVVVHLIVPPGTPIGQGNNLTDAQVEAGLELLNQSYANQGPFQTANGVDMGIAFCLARRDPNGKPTNGITRNESILVAETTPCTPFGTNASNDAAIKSLNNWDCKQYINIWLVTDLFNTSFGCGLAGYAYFPGAGCNIDGIVQESRYWITVGGTKVTSHEMGHFFSLNHTFSGGCTNADCLLDGDQVCDTPPDNSPSFAACNTNSCATDTPDLPDDNTNYMDYTSCNPPHFTSGQQVRAIAGLEKGRSTLISSLGCLAVENWDVGISNIDLKGMGCSNVFSPTITFKNNGLQTVTSLDIIVELNGIPSTIPWTGSLLANATASFTLPTQILAVGNYTLKVTLSKPNNNNDGYLANNSLLKNFSIYPIPSISLSKVTGSHCISDATVTVNATGGTSPYLFNSPGNGLIQNDGFFQLLLAGNHQFIVNDANNCADTIDVVVPDSCVNNTSNQFVINGNAVYLGGDCYRLTPAIVSAVGSIWYGKKINLKKDFVAEFDMNLGCIDANGADGLAFVLQPISTAIGTLGGGLGYAGVQPSLSVEFDTYRNCCNNSTALNSAEANDPFEDHVAIMKNGTTNHLSINNLAGPVDIISGKNAEDCKFHNVRVTWNATQQKITIFVDCIQRVTYQGDVVQSIFNNDPNVFFGFTAATGSAFNVQQVCLKYISFLDKIPDATICAGDKIQIAAPSDFTTYQWSPTTNISNPTSRNPIFSPSVSTSYIVSMTNKCGDLTRDTVDINVVNLDLDIDTTFLNPCSANPILKLTAKSKQIGVSYALDNNNFVPSNSIFEDHNYSFNQNYTLYAKLGNCVISKTVKISPPIPLSDSLIFQQNEFCQQKGYINIVGIGGKAPYQYSINNGTLQNIGEFNNLLAGKYTIKILDSKGCEISKTITINDLSKKIALAIDSSKLEIDCFDASSFIAVSASGTEPFYYFSLDNASFTSDFVFKKLSAGKHKLIARDDYGCLSDTLKFEVISHIYTASYSDTVRICPGQNYTFNGNIYSNPGIYYDTLKTIYGCDSIISTILLYKKAINTSIAKTLCQGQSIKIGNTIYTKSGTYIKNLTATNGCDSIVTLNLTINPPITNNLKIELCEKQSITINNHTYKTSGIYHDSLQTKNGCDSIINTSLTIIPSKTGKLEQSLCGNQSLIINGKTYTKIGVYFDTLKTKIGCDSVLTITIKNAAPNTYSEKKTICANEKLIIDGKNLTKSGIYNFTLKNKNQCDSFYTVDLTVLDTSLFYQEVILCAGDTLKLGNKIYVQTGTYDYVLKALNGCDSTLVTKIKRGEKDFCEDKYCKMFIPNSFSPNGDSQNDTFEIYTQVATLNQIQIFDRWGDLLYEETSSHPHWDGSSARGGFVNSGVYVYVLKGICSNGKPFIRKGDITLLR